MLWGFVVLSFAVAVYALIKKSVPWMVISTVLYAPFAIYLTMTPRFRGAILILVFYLVSVVLIKKRNLTLASVSLAPPVALATFLLVLIFITKH